MKETLTIRELIEEAVSESIDYHLQGLHESLTARVMTAVEALIKEQSAAEDPCDKANSAILAIQSVSQQVDILKALAEGAARFSPRVAIFILRGHLAVGWYAHGFEKNETIKTVSLDLGAGLLKTVMDSHQSTKVLIEAFDPKFVSAMNGFPEGECIVVPLVVRGKIAALLYADSGSSGSQIDRGAVELITRAASDWIELQALRKAAGAPQHYPQPARKEMPHQDGPADSAPAESPAPRIAPPEVAPTTVTSETAAQVGSVPALVPPAPAPSEPAHVAEAAPVYPVPASEPVGAHVPEPQPVQPAPPYAVEAATPHPVEAVQPHVAEPQLVHAAVELTPAHVVDPVRPSPIHAVEPEPVQVVPPPAQAAPVQAPAVQAHALSEEEMELHKKARRFAKLLVDEIVLYNRAAVAAGRQNHDLYDRLHEPIEKSRATFDQRYGKTSVAQCDYFNEALVSVLAGHNPSSLGSNFRR